MKEKVLFIFISTCMLITSIHIHAGAIQEANQQLRSIFSNLHRPSSTVRIFYDMAAHRVDSTFYDIMCADTTSCDTWYYRIIYMMKSTIQHTIPRLFLHLKVF